MTNSVVRNVGGRKNCSGYHWPETANQNAAGTVWTFRNNTGSSNCHGIFVWQNDSSIHQVVDFTGGGIAHGAYENGFRYLNPNVPYFEAHAVDFIVEGGSVGLVIGASGRFDGTAVFRNTQVTGFRLNNETSKPAPVHYIFENTGLSCDEIVVQSVKTGTRVTVDGEDCDL